MDRPESQLRDWYTDHLRPKIERAVRERTIGAAQAAELDRLMADVLSARRLP